MGDLSLTKLKSSDFFWSSESIRAKNLAKRPAWKTPSGVFSTPRLDMDRLTFIYSEVSAMPTYRGKHHWGKMKAESKRLKSLVAQQEETQQVYWSMIEDAIPESDSDGTEQERVWTLKSKSSNAQCEITGHKALVRACKGKVDMVSSYALQFHQVLVNLCARPELGWAESPAKAEAAAIAACAASGTD